MGKKEELIKTLKPIISNSKELEKYLIKHSNLPGPRANLELIFGLAEIYENLEVLLKWLSITEEKAKYCFQISEIVLKQMERENNFKIPRRARCFI